MGADSTWAAAAAGPYSAAAIKSNGTLWTWGYNQTGQLGYDTSPPQDDFGYCGSPASVLSPTQVGVDTNWTALAPAANDTYALKANGTIWASGYNGNGQLGNGDSSSYYQCTSGDTTTDSPVFVQVKLP